MKKIYYNLLLFFQTLKIVSLTIAALYSIFWFYRFFNLPFSDTLALFFNFFANPVINMFPTTQIHGNHVAEYAYFIAGIFFCILTFIFARLEDLMIILDRRYDIKTAVKKQILEEKMNKELKEEAAADILTYKYYSVLVQFKVAYISELISTTNPVTLEEAALRSYTNFVSLIKQWLPYTDAVQKGESVFITGKGFDDFDNTLDYILEAVKTVKIQNNNDAIGTDFIIAMDAQTSRANSYSSYNRLKALIETKYYNKALITSFFKARFEMIQEASKFTSDLLGFSALDGRKIEDSNLYILRSKAGQS